MRWTKVAGYSAVTPKILSWGERKSWLELFMTSWFTTCFRLSSHRRCSTAALWANICQMFLNMSFSSSKSSVPYTLQRKCCQPVRNMYSSSKKPKSEFNWEHEIYKTVSAVIPDQQQSFLIYHSSCLQKYQPDTCRSLFYSCTVYWFHFLVCSNIISYFMVSGKTEIFVMLLSPMKEADSHARWLSL